MTFDSERESQEDLLCFNQKLDMKVYNTNRLSGYRGSYINKIYGAENIG